jgi:hypothetical protein
MAGRVTFTHIRSHSHTYSHIHIHTVTFIHTVKFTEISPTSQSHDHSRSPAPMPTSPLPHSCRRPRRQGRHPAWSGSRRRRLQGRRPGACRPSPPRFIARRRVARAFSEKSGPARSQGRESRRVVVPVQLWSEWQRWLTGRRGDGETGGCRCGGGEVESRAVAALGPPLPISYRGRGSASPSGSAPVPAFTKRPTLSVLPSAEPGARPLFPHSPKGRAAATRPNTPLFPRPPIFFPSLGLAPCLCPLRVPYRPSLLCSRPCHLSSSPC